MIDIREFHPDDEVFRAVLDRGRTADEEIGAAVRPILEAVRDRGDEALLDYTERFDKVRLEAEGLRVSAEEMDAAQQAIEEEFLVAVTLARVNIRRFHEYQRRSGYMHDDGDGVRLSKIVTPLRRVGVYCPAGTAPLFSTMLMNVIPARLAGVKEIYAAVPPRPDGTVDPHMLVVAKLLDVDGVFRMGGAQAVAAFAHGTATVPRVDKIVGPGNAYVNMAKRMVFGLCGIDLPAGPSEIVVIADPLAKAKYVAADLMSQLEHGSGYEAGVVFTDSRDLAAGIRIEVERQIEALERKDLVVQALGRYGAIFLVEDLFQAVEASNAIAPEHLEIISTRQEEFLREVENAGAVFLGPHAPEPVGDYFAGTNHVLPTAGAARFASSLSVHDFVKDISVVEYSAARLRRTGRHIVTMARTEGLTAHANAVEVRLQDL